MAMRKSELLFGAVGALALSVAFACEAAAQTATQVGVSAAVRGQVSLSGSGGARQAGSGTPVFQNEKVATAADSSLQLLLRDETTFTVGENSDVTIDRFVFDPNTKTGQLVANFAKGTMRYVSGAIAKGPADTVNIKVPFGQIGIRGSEMFVTQTGPDSFFVGATGASRDANTGDRPTAVTVTPASGEPPVEIVSGFGVPVGPGGDVGDPVKIPAEVFSQMSDATNAAGGDGAPAGEGGGGASAAAGPGGAPEVADAGGEAGVEIDGFYEQVALGVEIDFENAEDVNDALGGSFDDLGSVVESLFARVSDLAGLPTTGYSQDDVAIYLCDSCYGFNGTTATNAFIDVFGGDVGDEIGTMRHSISANFATGQITIFAQNVDIPSWGVSGGSASNPADLPAAGAAVTPKTLLTPSLAAGIDVEGGAVILSLDQVADTAFTYYTFNNSNNGEQAISAAVLDPD